MCYVLTLLIHTSVISKSKKSELLFNTMTYVGHFMHFRLLAVLRHSINAIRYLKQSTIIMELQTI